MTDFNDLPVIQFVPNKIERHVFKKEALDSDMTEYLIHLIKQHGFHDYEPECIVLLQSCLIDFYHDLLLRFKQHFESLDSSITFHAAFERTLDEVMSSTLQDLQAYMIQTRKFL